MIPISLTLQGLYSYQERQTIDFTRLTQAHLFGIFGTVGSGKSSILEAITFALYGEIERLNKKDDKNYNMMNLKSNELFIEFEFKAGQDETLYKATVKGRRNSKKFYDVPTLKREAYEWVDEAWKPLEVEQLEAVIGLNYDNFKRTVIIPQGRFQEFLQLGNTDRTKMMKELFNLDRFELSGKVASLEYRNNSLLENLDGQLQQLADVKADQLEAMETELTSLKQMINELTVQHTALKQQEEALRGLKSLTDKLNTAQTSVLGLKEREPALVELENRLKAYEYCLLQFKSGLESAKKINSNVDRLAKTRTEDLATQNTLQEQHQHNTTAFESAQKAFENRGAIKQQIDELAVIVRIHQQAEARDGLKSRIVAGRTLYDATKQRVDKLTMEQQEATKTLKTLKTTQPDVKRLMEARAWFEEQARLETAGVSLQEERKAAEQALQEVEKQRIALLDESGLQQLDATATLAEWLNVLPKLRNTLQQQALTLQEAINQLSFQSKLEAHAASLTEGQPCPLCGATSHPTPFNAQHVTEAMADKHHQRERIQSETTKAEQLERQLQRLEATRRLQTDQFKKLTERQTEQEAARSSHQARFHWAEFPEKTAIEAALANSDQHQQAINKQEETLEALTNLLADERRKMETYNKALEDLQKQDTALEVEIATLKGQLKVSQSTSYENKTAADLDQERADLLNQLKAIEGAYQLAFDAQNATQQSLSNLAGRLDANDAQLKQEQASLNQTMATLQTTLTASPYSTLREVEQVLSQNLQLDIERKKCTAFKTALQAAEQAIAVLKAELGDRTYSEEAYNTVAEALNNTSDTLKRSHQKEGELTGTLTTTKARLDTKKELEKKTGQLKNRAEEIKTLKQLFKANGFVNYISTVYLQDLCNAATERFYHLTRQRLSLEITDDNNFQVRDHINGGKVRSVKTLSGGQTFQASLSLALALADNIQQLTTAKQNFFFLDEGFGSLDKESLDIVFDALKSLRKENRIVGVISHVDDMQQEIDTHLRITNDEERGSLIQTSW